MESTHRLASEPLSEISPSEPPRRRMPTERQSLTHKFCIDGHEGYLTAGLYDDGTVGELFISDVGKEGSTLRGVFSAWATTLSIALQHGVPLESLMRKSLTCASSRAARPTIRRSPRRTRSLTMWRAGWRRASSTLTPRTSWVC